MQHVEDLYITRDKRICGGEPVLKGTRFPVLRLLAEIAENRRLSEVCEDHDLDLQAAKMALLTLRLDRLSERNDQRRI